MKEYQLKKGKHSAKGIHFGLTFKKKLKFKAKFDKSCLYSYSKHIQDRYDVNKLFGFSTTWYHHKQSSRVGWRCLDNENIELFSYIYTGGKLLLEYLKEPIAIVKPNEEFTFEITDSETFCSFEFKRIIEKEKEINHNVKVIDKSPDWFLFHYYLFPFFGGDLTAPHDMKLYIDIL
ncbi:MAG: hypothetical protein ACOCVF_01565 [bacterium]